ncbi:helix-turn-helix domain-containing protein [Thalassomonas viridans]|uniref:Helix-turn-helix domain-containing protein n=1 Tax=Thalassomonas viridans TaxID=137584 RepID=A0AAE9Z061_9GAMM|nr:AraC family transcriptional regulator [Thalassomonas viridans]WDE04143.1 helix-turn-helix domain-containing protein [Thalassomonas viridans]
MKHLYIAGDWINALLAAFKKQGIDTCTLVDALPGFTRGKFIDGRRLELGSARLIWHRAAKLSGDSLLGIKIGQSLDYRALGVLAPLLWHSPDINTLLANVSRYQELISDNGTYKIHPFKAGGQELQPGAFYVEYLPRDDVIPVNAHQVLSVISATLMWLKAMAQDKLRPVKLRVPPTLNAVLIADYLDCEVITAEGNFRIYCLAEFSDAKNSGCDPHLYQINKAYADELLSAKKASSALIEKVKELIAGQGFIGAGLEPLALQLGMQKRTLQRHLSGQGTSFRDLKEEAARVYAIKVLSREKPDIEKLAFDLGYSEVSAFYRAFKTWFGVTPKQYIR